MSSAVAASTTIETHLSVVHLDGERVHKRMKAVQYAFVDFSTRQKRMEACEQEIRHNSVWAPGVYLGVGRWPGDPLEPTVEMRQLDDAYTLEALASRLSEVQIRKVGQFLATTHAGLPERQGAANPSAVHKRILDNLAELGELPQTHDLFERVFRAVHGALAAVAQELRSRRDQGRLLHGDLRCEHVYLHEDDVCVLDGVAFNPDLAEGDPAEDVAFLVMDLTCRLGRWDLEQALWEAAGIDASEQLRNLYVAHRALIRAKVALLTRPEEAQRFIVHALWRLESPARRPCLFAVGGLPGVGKSTLARRLAEAHDLEVLRSDVVRNELGDKDYSDAGRTQIYETFLGRATEQVLRGGRRIADASFGKNAWRRSLFSAARACGVRPVLVFCEVSEEVALERIAARTGDASDADARVYALAKGAWENPEPWMRPYLLSADTEGDTLPHLEARCGS